MQIYTVELTTQTCMQLIEAIKNLQFTHRKERNHIKNCFFHQKLRNCFSLKWKCRKLIFIQVAGRILYLTMSNNKSHCKFSITLQIKTYIDLLLTIKSKQFKEEKKTLQFSDLYEVYLRSVKFNTNHSTGLKSSKL